jgi:hypothetical protein
MNGTCNFLMTPLMLMQYRLSLQLVLCPLNIRTFSDGKMLGKVTALLRKYTRPYHQPMHFNFHQMEPEASCPQQIRSYAGHGKAKISHP